MDTGDLGAPDPGREGRQRPFHLRLASGISALLDGSGSVIGAACLSFMFVALLVNVFLRYVSGSGIAWAYEIHALLLPWLVAAGIVIAAARSRNIAITLLPDLLGPTARRNLLLVVQAIMLLVSLTVLQSSQPILKAAQFQNLSTLGIKQIWGYASLIYAFGAMAVIAIADMVRLLGGEGDFDTDPGNASLS